MPCLRFGLQVDSDLRDLHLELSQGRRIVISLTRTVGVNQVLVFFNLLVQSTNASSNSLIFSDVLRSFRLPRSSNFSAALAIMTSGWFNGNMFKKTNI